MDAEIMSRQMGSAVCFGIDERWLSLPIVNLPEGTIKVRRRLRYDSFAVAYVKTAIGIFRYHLEPDGTFATAKALKLRPHYTATNSVSER